MAAYRRVLGRVFRRVGAFPGIRAPARPGKAAGRRVSRHARPGEAGKGGGSELVGPAGPQAARAHAETDVVSAPVIVSAKKLGKMVLLAAVERVRV
ncbi:MAG TPA: hypothetical protein PKC73_13460 [Dermatophilaceae bacterium]|nr:hypothetical protein [Actinomycetales bacterium]HMT33314.1 hypothetical protein [Dermatophilaceae bacterium]HMT90635.1 hypothetical protein [Dermatophilaceae bacterium]